MKREDKEVEFEDNTFIFYGGNATASKPKPRKTSEGWVRFRGDGSSWQRMNAITFVPRPDAAYDTYGRSKAGFAAVGL